jgi:hypothetical protein
MIAKVNRNAAEEGGVVILAIEDERTSKCWPRDFLIRGRMHKQIHT